MNFCPIFFLLMADRIAIDIECSTASYVFSVAMMAYSFDSVSGKRKVAETLEVTRFVPWPTEEEQVLLLKEKEKKKENTNAEETGRNQFVQCNNTSQNSNEEEAQQQQQQQQQNKPSVFLYWDWSTFEFWAKHKNVFDTLQHPDKLVDSGEFWKRVVEFRSRHPNACFVTDNAIFDLGLVQANVLALYNKTLFLTPDYQAVFPIDVDQRWDGVCMALRATLSPSEYQHVQSQYKTYKDGIAKTLTPHNPLDDVSFIVAQDEFMTPSSLERVVLQARTSL